MSDEIRAEVEKDKDDEYAVNVIQGTSNYLLGDTDEGDYWLPKEIAEEIAERINEPSKIKPDGYIKFGEDRERNRIKEIIEGMIRKNNKRAEKCSEETKEFLQESTGTLEKLKSEIAQ